jgi:uncharacterized membrane protein
VQTILVEEALMAIRKEDWPLIEQAIEKAIAPLKPKGWRKAAFFMREWGILGTIASVIIALLGLSAAAFIRPLCEWAKRLHLRRIPLEPLRILISI